MVETWKDIKSYEGLYQISNLGRIKSLRKKIKNNGAFGKRKIITKNEKIVSSYKNKDGYSVVQLYKNNKRKLKFVHRLVAEAFIPNPENLPYVLHIIAISNGGTNISTNLYWGTQQQNIEDRTRDNHNNGVEIIQYNKNNEFVAKYKSIAEASRVTNINYNNIFMCCNNDKISNKHRKTAGGFIWKYAKEVI